MAGARSLFKFVGPDRIDVLRESCIRFTHPLALNDPFEFQPVFDRLLTEQQLQEAANPPFEMVEEAIRKQYSDLPDAYKNAASVDDIIASVRANPAVLSEMLSQFLPTLRAMVHEFTPMAREQLANVLHTRVGILSLSEDALEQLLWAHYADSHKGFAIEFDAEHPYFHRRRSDDDEFYHLRPVRYVHRNASGRALIDLDGEDLLLTKAPAWSYEKEWRMLLPLQDATRVIEVDGDIVHLFQFPLSAITQVILGARSSEALREALVAEVDKSDAHHIRLSMARIDSIQQSIWLEAL